MQIRIINPDLCEACTNRTCAFVDARMKEQFYSIRTETTVCPLAILIDETKSASFGDKCVKCALCVKSCFANNLEIDDYAQEFNIANLLEQQYNAIALGYLDKITGFAANTNRNRSLNFDGFLQTRVGESCFVEVDYNNDSLECCRRLIGAFITYEGHIGPIRNGLIVLQDFPKEGSRDVYNVIDKMIAFPTTKDCRIYFCTFSILRHMMLTGNTSNLTLAELFYNPRVETTKDYLQRIAEEGEIDKGQIQSLDGDNGKTQELSGDVNMSIIPIDDEFHEGCLPLFSFRVACGINEEQANPSEEAIGWVDASGQGFTPNPHRHFVVYAKGNSMVPRIHDGDLCVFEWGRHFGGTRNGEIVLARTPADDNDYQGKFTIKKYSSQWTRNEYGERRHSKIELLPLNTDKYDPIPLDKDAPETYYVVGVFKTVIK